MLELKLKILQNKPKEIILALDGDAFNDNVKYIKEFIDNDILVKFLKFPKNKDANDLGFKKIMELYNNANYINEFDLLNLKLGEI